jgi:oxaloacetate decarboxylase (Na+ extruding) subunit alpha
VLSRAGVEELRKLEPVHLEGARERFGRGISDEELLLRLTMPEEQVDAMLASPPASGRVARPDSRYPVATLLREVEKRKSVTHLRVQKGDDVVEWRRAT